MPELFLFQLSATASLQPGENVICVAQGRNHSGITRESFTLCVVNLLPISIVVLCVIKILLLITFRLLILTPNLYGPVI